MFQWIKRKKPHLNQGGWKKSGVRKEVGMKSNLPGPRNTINKGLEGEGKMESHGEELSSQMQLPQVWWEVGGKKLEHRSVLCG